ncbi:MAG: HAD family phosphatase [Clostridiales bacterium]|nr:HAD family phosphatase [Clostridiales bacterium]
MYLFDLDGTLIDSAGVWRQIDVDFLARRGIPWTEEYNQGVIHTIFPLAAQFTREYCNIPDSAEDIMAEWRRMALTEYRDHIPLKPYVRAFLEQCAGEAGSAAEVPLDGSRTMAIYTSCEPVLCQAVLRHHDVEDYFSQIVYASDLGMEKRSPAAFAAALERLGVRPEECRFFDDSPVSCAGAKAAGMTVIGVYDSLFAAQEEEMRRLCHAYIHDFSELLTPAEG